MGTALCHPKSTAVCVGLGLHASSGDRRNFSLSCIFFDQLSHESLIVRPSAQKATPFALQTTQSKP
jgi:hypothetical protein